ncbi:MAG TPA: SGNH/GDSL hydrolase family protein [Candidatus Saccharimonadales bacterium]|nr:SGNH/GDSL hydrolase family protein [Candidatus Saccharimonadales bacterium]
MKKQTAFFLFCVLILLVSFGAGYIHLVFKPQIKNNITNKAIFWSNEWRNYKTHVSGSEFSFAVDGVQSLSFQMHAEDTDSVELVVKVDNKVYTLQEPDINNKSLTIDIPQNDIHMEHIVTGKVYCLPGINPCDLQMKDIITKGGKIISWHNSEKTLGVLGDSISLFQLSHGYPALLSNTFQLHLHNASLWGRTAGVDHGKYPAVFLYQKSLIAYRPDIVIIFLGINDVYFGASEDSFKKDYETIVTGVRKDLPQAKVILVGMLPGKDSDEEAGRIIAFNNDIKSIAGEHKLTFADSRSWLTEGDYSDQFHPTIQGEAKIAYHLAKLIKN